MTYIVVALVVQAVISGGLCSYLAARKGYSAVAWCVSGFLFGVLGLIACAGLPEVHKEYRPALKRCPQCYESVRKEASVCRYCHYEFTDRRAANHRSGVRDQMELSGSIEEVAQKLHQEHPLWSMQVCRVKARIAKSKQRLE